MNDKLFPGFDNVYDVNDPLGNRAFRGGYETDADWVSIIRGEIIPQKPVIVKHYMGEKNPGYIIWTGACIPIIVHEKVIDLIEKNKFTGWSTYDVEVLDDKDKIIKGYFGISITGRIGTLSYEKSEIINKEFPGGIYPYYRGKYCDISTWDGSDFFMEHVGISGHKNGFTYALRNVVNAFKKEKISNIKFTKLTEFEIDVNTVNFKLK